LHYDVFFEKDAQVEHRQELCLSASFGIALFIIYLVVCMYMNDPFDEKWFKDRQKEGLLAIHSPVITHLQQMFVHSHTK